MAYESDRMIYMTSAATAHTAAAILAHPAAVPRLPWAMIIARMIYLLVSNPGAMHKAAEEWRDSEASDAALDAVEKGIRALRNKAQEEWKGEAADFFVARMDILLEELEKMRNYRDGSSQTLKQTAALYHHGAQFVAPVAALMSGLATASLIAIGKMVSAPTIATALRTIGNTLVRLFRMKLKALAAAGAILAGVNVYQVSQEELFLGMKALPGKTPDFKRAGAEGFPTGEPKSMSA
ncbi:WXG100 family type VII secretion target [Streptosporangium sp. CA-135522]|uniref:WXG100 family type VII secretion target n=1 Tax=Streptosporangium sp. CA-135522 TaxID=3240072 RepID=UPI003D8DAF40